jgi:hypothetical protein
LEKLKVSSLQRMITKEIWRIKLLRPGLMDCTNDDILLLAVHSMRVDLESQEVKKIVQV